MNIEQHKDWWGAVRTIASLMVREGLQAKDEGIFREELAHEGFSQPDIARALEWVDKVFLTGRLPEVVSMIGCEPTITRLTHPVERIMLPDEVLSQVEMCRAIGIFSSDVSERLLEGLRYLDTRDWDDADIESFILEVLDSAGNHSAKEQYVAYRKGLFQERFH